MKDFHEDRSVSMSRHVRFAVILGLLFWTLQFATAQNRFSITLGGGGDFTTQDLGDASLNTGVGFEGLFSYRFMPHVSAYAGWGWNHFSADRSFAGTDIDFEETGYTAGLRFMHPFGTSRFGYMVGAGGILNHIEAENTDGDIIADTGHGFGWQAEAGVFINFGERWRLIPGVRYRSLSREFEIDAVKTSVDLNYISANLGVSWSF